MTVRYRDYDAFARMYDRHWGPQGTRHLDVLHEHVLCASPSAARILDLCCGTGQLARILGDRGYEVTGIDGSDAMIEYARRNAPAAAFQVADARTFRCEATFDVVLCMFDSLNHVMTEEDLAAVFQRVAAVLDNAGVFAFDLNMEPKYLQTWSGEFSVVEDHEVCIVRTGVAPDRRLASFDATLFYDEPDGRWSRHELHLEQTWYAADRVARILETCGFERPTTHTKQEAPDGTGVAHNLLFVTCKRAPA